jgi:hypothetical protein
LTFVCVSITRGRKHAFVMNKNSKTIKKTRRRNRNRRTQDKKEGFNYGNLKTMVFNSYGTRPTATPKPAQNVKFRQLVNLFTLENGMVNTNHFQAASTTSLGSLAFCLADCDNATAFAALFDQYRIDRVEVFIRPSFSGYSAPSATADIPPTLFVVNDWDNFTTPSGTAYLRQYDNCTDVAPYEGCVRSFRPACTLATYSGGAFSGYAPTDPVWLDTVNPSVQHYGLKFGCTPWAGSEIIDWVFEAYYYLSFRSVI